MPQYRVFLPVTYPFTQNRPSKLGRILWQYKYVQQFKGLAILLMPDFSVSSIFTHQVINAHQKNGMFTCFF